MRVKGFDDYVKQYSTDPSVFEKQVIFASPLGGSELFEVIQEASSNFADIGDHPIILWDNFNIEHSKVNEGTSHIYNMSKFPTFEKICEELSTESYIPPSIADRTKIKSLKFPIVATKGNESEVFKTYGKFKKSEKFFEKFKQKIIPITRYDVIAFKDEPIHIQERINGIGFDSNYRRFKHPDKVTKIVKKINEKYRPDFYHLEILEAKDGIYLNSVSTSAPLSPTQNMKMYETAYESFYSRRLPKWFRDNVFESYIKPYYEKRYLDSLLIKPKNSIDFKKYAKTT